MGSDLETDLMQLRQDHSLSETEGETL